MRTGSDLYVTRGPEACPSSKSPPASTSLGGGCDTSSSRAALWRENLDGRMYAPFRIKEGKEPSREARHAGDGVRRFAATWSTTRLAKIPGRVHGPWVK